MGDSRNLDSNSWKWNRARFRNARFRYQWNRARFPDSGIAHHYPPPRGCYVILQRPLIEFWIFQVSVSNILVSYRYRSGTQRSTPHTTTTYDLPHTPLLPLSTY